VYDALILVNGEIPSQDLWQSVPYRVLICTDGAANTLQQTDIIPDIIIGDMDSISDSTKIRYPQAEIISLSDQTTTDFEKALIFSEKMKYTRILCLGMLGKSADHFVYNLSLLVRFATQLEVIGLNFIDEAPQWIFPLQSKTTIHTLPHQTISFLAFPEATLTTQGLRWELQNTLLTQVKHHSVRNQTLSNEVEINCQGNCLAFLTENPGSHTEWQKKVNYCNNP
jgi:thiamine pyrophosphokinase